jgi:hypothetical protein
MLRIWVISRVFYHGQTGIGGEEGRRDGVMEREEERRRERRREKRKISVHQ